MCAGNEISRSTAGWSACKVSVTEVKEEEEDEVNAISACKLNTWNGGEAITTRRNLKVDMEPTFEIFYI